MSRSRLESYKRNFNVSAGEANISVSGDKRLGLEFLCLVPIPAWTIGGVKKSVWPEFGILLLNVREH